MKVILPVLLLTVTLIMGVRSGYHSEIGIPLAKRIKEAEYKLFAARSNETSAKIVGGDVVSQSEHPYLAGLIVWLYDLSQSTCGSSLVTANRLVTAAHCVMNDNSGVKALVMQVVLGSQYLYFGGLRIATSVAIIHPQYGRNLAAAVNNDIAVIYLPKPVKFSDNIRPIRLAPPSSVPDQFVGQNAVAIGYGKTSQNDANKTPEVRRVTLRVLPDAICLVFYGSWPGSIICTSGDHGVGACEGDSGGPLVLTNNGTETLIGVTSFGPLICEIGLPDGFTSVSSVMDFLRMHIA